MTTPASETLRIALPRGAQLEQLIAHFEACGFSLQKLAAGETTAAAQDPLKLGFDFEFVVVSAVDVGTYVEHGVCHAGVLSTDLIGESDFNVWRPFTFNFGSYPLVLAAWRGQNLQTLVSKPVLRPATPLPRFAKDWFTARGIPTEVITVEDDGSMAVSLGLADCWVNRLTDPEALVAAGFRVVEAMGRTYLKLVVNPAAASRRRAAIRLLIESLEANSPPPPPEIPIPFDNEDPV